MCFGIKSGEKVAESVRQFCLALHYYSPRAYKQLREAFNKNLPSPRTLQAWYANSDCNGEPGIQAETIERLKRIVEAHDKKNNSILLCSLVFDKMNVRQQISWTKHHGYNGYVDDIDFDEIPEIPQSSTVETEKKSLPAQQGIVFILNGINYSFEFPVAYWLIRKLNKHQKKRLLIKVIEAITKVGIKVLNVTFDGDASNAPMCELLGAQLNILQPGFQPYFLNPVNGEKIYIIMDPCHMEKLIRNTLGCKGVIYDGTNSRIEWRFIENLYNFSKQNDLLTHKLNKKHMQWKRNMMNVSQASQTLSQSVANSIKFLMEKNHPEFLGAEPTIKLLEIADRLFDIFNSKDMFKSNIFKRPMYSENKRVIIEFLSSCVDYIKR